MNLSCRKTQIAEAARKPRVPGRTATRVTTIRQLRVTTKQSRVGRAGVGLDRAMIAVLLGGPQAAVKQSAGIWTWRNGYRKHEAGARHLRRIEACVAEGKRQRWLSWG
jgi:hypothetical protein